ncbi:hypothetical protein BS47DRAFT_1328073 [Hydnum rufescens UP504]|uniref:Cyclin-domain-containing protein n=1 Tax=Hydnum rufescens UP504 TaxID=1448309 RepID=A0A9P6B0X0_9AGAM|nr:hypothetical protein BS47DRAFT_1328073 [Hydnum rufescens UP504]
METPIVSTEPRVVPYDFEDCPMDDLVLMIADMLDRLLKHNDQIPLMPEALTRFHSRSPPAISVLDYLRRIVKYTNLERSCLLITLHYIDQMCGNLPRFTISSLTVHRFIIASVTVSTKALCDAFGTNSHYAKIGGIRVGELNVLEREFLASLDWRLACTRELLQAYYVNLARSHSTGAFRVADPPSPPSVSISTSSSPPPQATPHPLAMPPRSAPPVSPSSLPVHEATGPSDVSYTSSLPAHLASNPEGRIEIDPTGNVPIVDHAKHEHPVESAGNDDLPAIESLSARTTISEEIVVDVPVPPPLNTQPNSPMSMTATAVTSPPPVPNRLTASPRRNSKRRQSVTSLLDCDGIVGPQVRRRRVEAQVAAAEAAG